MMNLLMAPWRASLAMTAQSLETMLTLQKSMLSGVESGGPMSFPDENKLRAAFHKSAGDNLRRWEDVAEQLQDLPDWMHSFTRVPGPILTDFFDAARRRK